MLEPLSPLPGNLEESMASVNQMDVTNITEAAVYLDDPPQVWVIDSTDVDNTLVGRDAVENPAITENWVSRQG